MFPGPLCPVQQAGRSEGSALRYTEHADDMLQMDKGFSKTSAAVRHGSCTSGALHWRRAGARGLLSQACLRD